MSTWSPSGGWLTVKWSFGDLKITGEWKKKRHVDNSCHAGGLAGSEVVRNDCSPQRQTLWRAEWVPTHQALPTSGRHVLGDIQRMWFPSGNCPAQRAIVSLPLRFLCQLMSVGSHRCFKSFAWLLLPWGQYINSMAESLSPVPLTGSWPDGTCGCYVGM